MKAHVLIFYSFIGFTFQASTPTSSTYEAGVVEISYEKDLKLTPAQTLASNLAQYLDVMKNAPANLDIIVFPEMTLNYMLTSVETPEPDQKISPCDNSDYKSDNLMKQISCSAKNFSRYVVVNIVTHAKCPDADMIANKDPRKCSARKDGFSYYNTNVVFDRNGSLISRYRKFNLFGEEVDKPSKPAMVTFETDFGVKFGHFVCFDLMFRAPALDLVRKENVTDIVFTSMWYSEMPFLTAAAVQQNWAYSNNVNLLAAGANNPAVGSSGTGIYAGKKGSLISVMHGTSKTNIYTATVPKKGLGDAIVVNPVSIKNPRQEMAPLKLKRDQLDKYHIKFLDGYQMTPDTSITKEECFGDLCCSFTFSFSVKTGIQRYYRYATAVYHGNRTFDGFADGGVVACAFIACQTLDIATCGVRDESLSFAHDWYYLEVSGKFPQGDDFFFLPTTLDESVMSFGVNEFDYKQGVVRVFNETHSTSYNQISMKTVGDIRSFYSFGIYGRDFNLDETDSAGILNLSYLMIIFFATIVTLKNLV